MKRKTFSSRLLAILMTVALVLSFASVSAFAEGDMALHKYEGDQQWTTITLDQEDQGVPAGTYYGETVNNIAVVKQASFVVVFGATEMSEELKDAILKVDGSILNDDGTPKDRTFYYAGNASSYKVNDKGGATYYFGYQKDGQTYVLAPKDKVSHFLTDIEPGTTPTPEKPNIPSVEKAVSVDNGTSYSTEVSTATGDANTVTFKLTTNVPKTQATESITIHDQMASEFTGPDASNDFTVTLDRNGTEDDKDLASHITFDASPADGCTFHLTIDVKAAEEAGVIENSDFDNTTPIVITYTANLKDATAAGAYTNTAWTQETSKSTVTVDTYGIQIFKYDGSTVGEDSSLENATGLQGAQFALYSSDDVTVTNDKATVNQDATPIWTGSSGTNGYVTINGLAEGTYYLVETETPTGYTGASEPISVTVSKEAAGTDYTVDVNVANTKTPTTGGAGTMFYTFGGLAIVAAAGVVFLASRKSRKQSA